MEPKKLKVKKLQINPGTDDNTGVDCISVVNAPAIEKNFIAFSAAEREKFQVTDNARQIVTGPIMIPDKMIYRNQKDEQGNIIDEWYVFADKQTIYQVMQKFFQTQRTANTSLEHDGALLNGVYLIESFQVDSTRGICPPAGYGAIPDGTWFGSMKVDVPEIWAAIVGGTFNGFSIEGLFTYEPTPIVIQHKSELALFMELGALVSCI